MTFNNYRSYMKAVSAAFIEIKTPKFTKKVQVLVHKIKGYQLSNCALVKLSPPKFNPTTLLPTYGCPKISKQIANK